VPQTLWYPYAQMRGLDVQNDVVSARGTRLRLSDGRELIDAIASWWCVIHGYAHPVLDAAVAAQAADFAHIMLGGLTHAPARELADALVAVAPPGLAHVFFADSGSVGMEVAMKMAVQFWRNQGETGRHAFLSLRHAYHGDTTGVMSLGDPGDGMHHRFGDYLPKQIFVRPPEGAGGHQGAIRYPLDAAIDELRAALGLHHGRIAAFVCEPRLQAAGGFNMYPAAYLRAARELCDEFGVLMICDEVATGFGRTGTLFACEQAGITPDILVLAKGLSAGYLGLSATLATGQVFEAFLGEDDSRAFLHGPTFMGNALACAVAKASLTLFQQEKTLDKIAAIERVLCGELATVRGPAVVETRVLGACGVVEVRNPAQLAGLQAFAQDRGVWLRPFDRVAYTMPAYIMTEPDLRTICGVLRDWFAR
jgi:adenosylmethionine-8-amino-7-oxononanoate aminotransferase